MIGYYLRVMGVRMIGYCLAVMGGVRDDWLLFGGGRDLSLCCGWIFEGYGGLGMIGYCLGLGLGGWVGDICPCVVIGYLRVMGG